MSLQQNEWSGQIIVTPPQKGGRRKEISSFQRMIPSIFASIIYKDPAGVIRLLQDVFAQGVCSPRVSSFRRVPGHAMLRCREKGRRKERHKPTVWFMSNCETDFTFQVRCRQSKSVETSFVWAFHLFNTMIPQHVARWSRWRVKDCSDGRWSLQILVGSNCWHMFCLIVHEQHMICGSTCVQCVFVVTLVVVGDVNACVL